MAEYAQKTMPPRPAPDAATRTASRLPLPRPSSSEAADRNTLQAVLNRSPRVQALAQLQRSINQSPVAVAQRQQLARRFGDTERRASAEDEIRWTAVPPLIYPEKDGALEPAAAVFAPVQRQLNRKVFIDQTKPSSGMDQGFRNKLLAAIDRYNRNEKRKDHSETNTHDNLAALDDIEHRIYAWFDENKMGASWDSRSAMFHLMNEVQENHKYWIAAAVEEGHEMWTSDEVEDEDEKQLINQLWSHIADGTGAFEFKTNVHTAEGFKDLPESALKKFKTEVWAMLARLYSRPKGRELLKALDKGAVDDQTISFFMSPIYKILGRNRHFDTPYVGARAAAYDERAATVKLKGKKQKNRRVVPGKGSGAGVEIAPGIKDASMMDFDAEGNQILSPAFIGLGHELIHAGHYGAGTYIGMKPHDSRHARVRGEYGDDVEEFLTIASPQERQKAKNVNVTSTLEQLSGGRQQHTFKMSELDKLNINKGIPTEAEIREEHGLSIRHGHTTTANPSLYRGARKGENPGEYVTDAIDWITPHLDEISPPEPDVVEGGEGRIVVDSRLSAFLKTLGVTVAVGSVISLGLIIALYLSYGNPFAREPAP